MKVIHLTLLALLLGANLLYSAEIEEISEPLLIPPTEIESTSVYADMEVGKFVPAETLFMKGILPEIIPQTFHIKVIDNTDQCLVDCHLDLEITSDIPFTKSDLDAYFSNEEAIQYTEIQHRVVRERDAYCIEKTGEFITNDEGEEQEVIRSYICGRQEYYAWENSDFSAKANEPTVVRIVGAKLPKTNVDAVPVVLGEEVPELAWWNSSWGYECRFGVNHTEENMLILVYDAECDIDRTNFPTNYTDARWVVEWSGGSFTEIPYVFLNRGNATGGGNYSYDNDYAWFGLNSTYFMGNTSDEFDLIFYQNNTLATYTQDARLVASHSKSVPSFACDWANASECDYMPDAGAINANYYTTYAGAYGVAECEGNGANNCVLSNGGGTGNASNTSEVWLAYRVQTKSVGASWRNMMQWSDDAGNEAYLLSADNDFGSFGKFETEEDNVKEDTNLNQGGNFQTGKWLYAKMGRDGPEEGGDGLFYAGFSLIANHSTQVPDDNGEIDPYIGTHASVTEGILIDWMMYIAPGWDEGNITFLSAANYTPGGGGFPAPVLDTLDIGPPVVTNSSTAYCQVNYTGPNATFDVYLGLATNGVINDTYNRTVSPYTNATLWQENFSLVLLAPGTNISCWSFADNGNLSGTNYTGNLTLGADVFTINNYTFTNPQYETVPYNYTINFTLGFDDTNATAELEYNNRNFTANCSNVSDTFLCWYNGLPAPPVAVNTTLINVTWFISVDAGEDNETQLFGVDVAWGIWPLEINSTPQVAEQYDAEINVSYGSEPGITGTVAGTVELGGNSETLVCAGGFCTANTTAPEVNAPTIYQTDGNLSLYSAFWLDTDYRNISIEETYYLIGSNATYTQYQTTHPERANDDDWVTYAYSFSGGDWLSYNFSGYTQLMELSQYKVKDGGNIRNFNSVPEDCWGLNMVFNYTYIGGSGYHSCYNFSSGSFVALGDYVFADDRLYEGNLTLLKNNSFTRVVPYGLTNCSSGLPVLHFEVRDEESNNLIVADYQQIFYIETPAGNQTSAFIGTDDEWDLCIYPINLTANITSDERYEATNYSVRLFSLNTTPIAAGTVLNYTRYLAGNATAYTFHIIDIYDQDIQDVEITVRAFNFVTLDWEIVSEATTDVTGTSTFFFVPYRVYRMTMEHDDYQDTEFDFVPAAITFIEVTMYPEADIPLPTPDFEDYVWNDVAVEFSPAEGYYSTNQLLRYTVLSNSSSLEWYSMRVTFTPTNGTTTTVYSSNVSISPAGGSIQYTTTANGTYRLYSDFKHSNYSLFTNHPRLYYINQNVTGLAAARDIMESEEPVSGWGFYLALLVVAMLGAGYISMYSKEGAIVVAVVILWFGSLMFSTAEVVVLFGNPLNPINITALLTMIGIGAVVWKGGL